MRDVTVVGASLAGLSTVRALRDQAFAGRIVVVGEEKHAPYDRPPLSKEFLAGSASEVDISLVEVFAKVLRERQREPCSGPDPHIRIDPEAVPREHIQLGP